MKISSEEQIGDLLTTDQAAGVLAVCRETVYRLVAKKQLTARRVGRLLRISRGDIRDYLDRAKTE